MSEPKVLFEIHDPGIGLLTLNDPARRNPISDSSMVEAIVSTLQSAALNPDLRALVITGAGTSFSSGGDVRAMRAKQGMVAGEPHQVAGAYTDSVQRIPVIMEQLTIPVIAAVNGPAFGAGCDISLMCDLRIASRSAVFGEVFVNLGIVSGDGGGWYLTRLLGYQRAAEISLRGRPIGADEALKLGLVLEVVDEDALLDHAITIARDIAQKPPAAVRMTKQLLKMATRTDLKDYLAACAAMQAVAHESADHMAALEGMIKEKRS